MLDYDITLGDIQELADSLLIEPDRRPPLLRRLQDEPTSKGLYYRFLWAFTAKFKPPYIVEIGTRYGRSAAQMGLGSPSSKIVSVEIDPLRAARARGLKIPNVEVITGNSVYPNTVKQVMDRVPWIDVLFIDSNHEYKTVLSELNVYSPYVALNGIMLFDDIALNDDMRKFWDDCVKEPKLEIPFLHRMRGASFGFKIKK